MSYSIVLALHLILVHVPGGDEIQLNPVEVSSIRDPRDIPGHFAKDVHCVIVMTNGKFIGAVEDCHTVKFMIEAATEEKR